jgi:Tol biopolymer transport system component
LGVLTAITFLVASCSDEVLSLGKQIPFTFGPPTLVVELALPGAERGNPTLTSDHLEIYFTSKQDDDQNVWMAARAARTASFGAPVPVDATVSPDRETSSAISQDGLTLWFGSNRDGGLGNIDIWATTRAERMSPWATPKNLASLNSPDRDIPRPPGLRELVMPMASDRQTPGEYQTMMATRADRSADFATPSALPELAGKGETVDACLTEDGLYLFLSRGDPSDLYVTQRPSLSSPFGPLVPLSGLNTVAMESDPFMSPDQTAFYFSSDRGGGTLQIYVATVQSRTR